MARVAVHLDDLTAAHGDYAIRHGGNPGVVRNDGSGRAESRIHAFDNLQHYLARLEIQSAGGPAVPGQYLST